MLTCIHRGGFGDVTCSLHTDLQSIADPMPKNVTSSTILSCFEKISIFFFYLNRSSLNWSSRAFAVIDTTVEPRQTPWLVVYMFSLASPRSHPTETKKAYESNFNLNLTWYSRKTMRNNRDYLGQKLSYRSIPYNVRFEIIVSIPGP